MERFANPFQHFKFLKVFLAFVFAEGRKCEGRVELISEPPDIIYLLTITVVILSLLRETPKCALGTTHGRAHVRKGAREGETGCAHTYI